MDNVGKGYGCKGLFRLSLSNALKLLNMFAMRMSPIFGIHDFVVLTFGFMTRLAMSLIPKLTNFKSSKCQVCMKES
jgi:hypothetical protein